MNICACIIGESNFPTSIVHIFRYPTGLSHSDAIREAMEQGFTSVILIDNAIFDPRREFMLAGILQSIASDQSECVFLGGEQFGPLLGIQTPLFGIRKSTITHCNHAYVLRYGGMRRLVSLNIVRPTVMNWMQFSTSAVVPSIASLRACPNWVLNLPRIPSVLPKFNTHREFQEFLETRWQSFIKSMIMYAVFSILANKVKCVIRQNCT